LTFEKTDFIDFSLRMWYHDENIVFDGVFRDRRNCAARLYRRGVMQQWGNTSLSVSAWGF
jgi:hypothetical protein